MQATFNTCLNWLFPLKTIYIHGMQAIQVTLSIPKNLL